MRPQFLTSAEVAHLLGVAPTSVKRWADAGLLSCYTTPGRHRRFTREEVERFRRDHRRGAPPEPTPVEAWLALLDSPRGAALLHAELLLQRDVCGSWWRLADRLGTVVERIGEDWARGDLSVVGEHERSERLARALAACVEASEVRDGAPVCLLASAEGDAHTLGLRLAELCLREAGWATRWVGAPTPAAELLAPIERGEVAMVALSASEAASARARLDAQARTIAAACDRASVALVLGGAGPWPEPMPPAGPGSGRVRTFADFHALLGRHPAAVR